MAERSRNPSKSTGQFAIRLCIGEPHGPRSSTWRIWSNPNKSDVYVTVRNLGGTFKVSLHESGNWRFGFVDAAAAAHRGFIDAGADRAVHKWERPEAIERVTKGLEIIVPRSELRATPSADDDDPKVIWLSPPPDDFSARILIGLTSPPVDPREARQHAPGSLIADHALPNKDHVWVWRQDLPITYENRQVLAAVKREMVKQLGRSRQIPDTLRGFAHGHAPDGTRWYLDVAPDDQ